jgi:hypothetical protein
LNKDSIPLEGSTIYTANKKILGKVEELKGQMGGLPYAEIIPDKKSEVPFSSIEEKDKVSLNSHINTS